MPNKDALLDKIASSGLPVSELCKRANLTRASFYNKLNGKREWKASEIKRLSDTLHINRNEMNHIFFS